LVAKHQSMVAIVSQSGGPPLPPLMPCFHEKDLVGCCKVLGGNIPARLQEWKYLVEFISQFVATFCLDKLHCTFLMDRVHDSNPGFSHQEGT
jgi:hypothetical protein